VCTRVYLVQHGAVGHAVQQGIRLQVQQGIRLQAVPGGAGERLAVSALNRRAASGQRTDANLRSAMYWRFRLGNCAVKLHRRLGCIVIDIGQGSKDASIGASLSSDHGRCLFVRRQRAVIP
jgi:hypothetical protein